MKRVILFGDSIFKGVVYDAESGRYRLSHTRVSVEGADVLNCSKMGATIETGLEIIRRRLPEITPEDVCVLEYGGNDCNYNWKEISERPDTGHLCAVPPERFAALYAEAVELLKSTGAKIAVSTLAPISAPKFFDYISRGLDARNILHWLGDVERLSRWQASYSAAVEKIAASLSVSLLPVRNAVDSPDWCDLVCADGIHPTDPGHARIDRFVGDWLAAAY